MKRIFIFFLTFLLQASSGWPATEEPPDFSEERLNERVLLLHQAPWAETMTVMDAGSALIVVDTWGSPVSAQKAHARMDSVFHKKVGWVIDTHHHWDHTFGNAAFPGVELVGHLYCAEDMKTEYQDAALRRALFAESVANTPQPALREYILRIAAETSGESFRLVLPNRLIADRETLHAGDLTVHLFPTPGIHTRSNLTLYIPELGILFGRREFSEATQLKWEPGAEPSRIAKVLEDILALNQPLRYLIPGHGKPIENPNLKATLTKWKDLSPR